LSFSVKNIRLNAGETNLPIILVATSDLTSIVRTNFKRTFTEAFALNIIIASSNSNSTSSLEKEETRSTFGTNKSSSCCEILHAVIIFQKALFVNYQVTLLTG
jgi:hypothetical protein